MLLQIVHALDTHRRALAGIPPSHAVLPLSETGIIPLLGFDLTTQPDVILMINPTGYNHRLIPADNARPGS